MPRLATTDSSIHAWRVAWRCAFTRPWAAYQSTTVETHKRMTNGGFHAE